MIHVYFVDRPGFIEWKVVLLSDIAMGPDVIHPNMACNEWIKDPDHCVLPRSPGVLAYLAY